MESEPLEQLPATKPGDRVLRRTKKPRGMLHSVCRSISRRFKSITSKHQETR
jgi:hypothetical protein